MILLMVLPRFTESLHPGKGGNPGFNSYDLDSCSGRVSPGRTGLDVAYPDVPHPFAGDSIESEIVTPKPTMMLHTLSSQPYRRVLLGSGKSMVVGGVAVIIPIGIGLLWRMEKRIQALVALADAFQNTKSNAA